MYAQSGRRDPQREVNIDHSPAAPSRATNSATVMLNGKAAALGISATLHVAKRVPV